jgi:hypothetical protein
MMKIYSIFIFFLVSSCLYREKHPYSLSLQNTITLDSVPSASGIAIVKDSAYVIGDDATCIYKLSLQTQQFRKIQIPGAQPGLYRVPKDSKNDFETAAIGTINQKTYFLAFGSGTLSPFRDSFLFMDLDNEADLRIISIAAFYNQLLQKNKLDKNNFNIEGAAISGNHLYLFNRAGGMIFQVNWNDFFQYINDPVSQAVPASTTHVIQLPEQSGVKAGFSGACTLDDETILFTASLENTKNWIDDGEITGSYVGVLDVTAQVISLNTGLLLRQGNEALKVKLESLDVVSVSKDNIIIECVADNVNGTSAFYRLGLKKE